MPIYEYQCEECNLRFEVLVRRISNPLTVACEKCRSTKIRKLISGFAFKGSKGGQASKDCSSCTSNKCSSCG